MPSMKLNDEIEVYIYSNGERFRYRATVTEVAGKEFWVTLETGEVRKLERRRCEIVSEGER